MVPCGIRSEGLVMNTQDDTPPSSPTTSRLLDLFPCESVVVLDLFPCQGGEFACRVPPSVTRNETGVSLAYFRNMPGVERDIMNATELTLSIEADIWKIKKTLTTSDVGSQTRLLIPKEPANEHILKYLTEEEIKLVEDEGHQGLKITVFDSKDRTTRQLCFKRWTSAGSYVLNNNWNKDFVQRKKLKAGETIGLFWNPYASRLHLRVL
ncbi:PREDICTED: putative B3 domain-containing protein At1g78640 [Camelina sativa]|uniref:B3 domain-containing protein At1g78640 n=1 Tax=Camelina sativa TaxID=90675 RepID=A0ABM0XR69_CAMSA|nr:PREDICTED: putative B3 domain-containing protein At1g78640 [Camelina sativa]